MKINKRFTGGTRVKARALAFITAVAMIMSAVPVLADEADEPEENIVTLATAGDVVVSGNYGSGGTDDSSITYTLTTNEDGETYTLTFTGSGDMYDYDSSGDNVFTKCPWYTYRKSITEVNITSGITSIGKYAFFGITSLTNITIPNTVTTLKTSAFENGGLVSVTIPDSVTTLGTGVFSCVRAWRKL